MNTFAVVCLLLGCSVMAQAMYVKPKYPVKQVYCYDYMGRPVYPGQSYYDGCNTCTCGRYGRPTICTYRYCGDIIDPVRPILPINPVKPVYPIRPVKPVKPVHPVPY
ncbi:uncharacterized protein LOC123562974 [Mercenaria mercenaria]|uniref:uncharacterized protein LOC123562974 n=1 Tax=Mercenaria mercenaria TaxID=6596 RepID=UPI00234E91A5|nr:uncharacterized protein LOC123562974 [Mercenaria mercenaria]